MAAAAVTPAAQVTSCFSTTAPEGAIFGVRLADDEPHTGSCDALMGLADMAIPRREISIDQLSGDVYCVLTVHRPEIWA